MTDNQNAKFEYPRTYPLRKNILLTLGLAVIFASVTAQPTGARLAPYARPRGLLSQENDRAAIKTADGFLFVWNRPDLYFTISIKGKVIEPLNDPDHVFFNVDGMVFQLQLASISEFAPDARMKKLDDKNILAAHRDWESKFVEDLLGKKLQVQTHNTKLSNGGDALLWQFDMPEGTNADAKKQLYLTIVSKSYVLLLNGVANANVSETTVRKYLLDTIATLKISAVPIDVKQLAESIRKGGAP
jgi:hypothetical protein